MKNNYSFRALVIGLLMIFILLGVFVLIKPRATGNYISIQNNINIMDENENTYWVSPNGTATWANCRSVTPLSGANACSIYTASSNVVAGDAVNLRNGSYTLSSQYGTHISLNNKNGASSNPIVFRNYNNEEVNFIGTYGIRMWGFLIHNSSNILLEGITFSDYSDYLIRASSNHIEIRNCTFKESTYPYKGGSLIMVEDCGGGRDFRCPVSNLWIHNNTFYKLSAGGGCSGNGISEGGDAVRIGYTSITCYSDPATGQRINCAQGFNSNITIEDNYMAYGGHTVMDSYSIRSVFKNNIAHNEPWYPADNGNCAVGHQPVYDNAAYNGLYSHRVWQFTDTHSRNYSYNLIESNRLGHAGVNPNNDGSTSLVIASPGNIVRFNAAYGAMNNAMKTKYGANYGWQASGGINNRIYSNTLYKNGYGYPFFQNCCNSFDKNCPSQLQSASCPKPLWGFRWYAPADSPGNILVNNIVYGSYGAVEKGNDDIQDSQSGSLIYNNFCSRENTKCIASGDPLFINPDLSQPTSKILPDLRLQSNSPAKDIGTYLTQANGSGTNSLNIVVDDALFFQDGTWGASMARGLTLFPDWIAVGDIGNAVEIKSIDYLTNTITLKDPITWENNAPIWLYKDSSGRRVLYGDAPDIGAYEFISQDQQSQPVCGNELCESEENCSLCASDCGSCNNIMNETCGNGYCNLTAGETCSNCASDCGSCRVEDENNERGGGEGGSNNPYANQIINNSNKISNNSSPLENIEDKEKVNLNALGDALEEAFSLSDDKISGTPQEVFEEVKMRNIIRFIILVGICMTILVLWAIKVVLKHQNDDLEHTIEIKNSEQNN